MKNEKIDCVLANCEGILPLSKSLFPLLQHASSIIAEGYEHACEISELAFTAPAERLFLDCDSAEQAAFNKNIVRGIGMSNLRTLRQSIAYSPTQNVKARAGYLQPLPVIDPRGLARQTSTGPAVVPHLEELRVALLQMFRPELMLG